MNRLVITGDIVIDIALAIGIMFSGQPWGLLAFGILLARFAGWRGWAL